MAGLLGTAVAEAVDLEAVETALRRRVLGVAARQLQEHCRSLRLSGQHPAVRLRSSGALRGAASEVLRQRAGGTELGAGLLSLLGLRPRALPARPGAGPGGRFLLARPAAYDGERGGHGEF